MGNSRNDKVDGPPTNRSTRSLSCYQVALNNQAPSAAPGFQQKIPTMEYLNQKRHSVFQKVDLKALETIKIPEYPKTDAQMQVIMPLLKEIGLVTAQFRRSQP